MKWISVKRRLPKANGTYMCKIIYNISGLVFECKGRVKYNINNGWAHDDEYITHWMTLEDSDRFETEYKS